MFLAGLLQIASVYAPAARVRIYGAIPFHRIPNGGAALLTLGVLTLVVALRPTGWWRWVPAPLSAAVLAIVYWRITHNPSLTFIDPLLRRLVHPSWGFMPMSAAVAGSFIGAATVRRTGLADEAPTRIDASSAIPSPTSGH
jgi:hypothetical protein